MPSREAFGLAYAEAGECDPAITWYERALQCNDASASMKAHEQLGNLRARRGWARAAAAEPASAAMAQARADITHALHELQALADLQPTLERHSLCGSAYKRLAMLEHKAGNAAAEKAALQQAALAYGRAEALAAASQHPELFYPALNRMALEWVANVGHRGWPGFDATASAAVRRSLQAKTQIDPDFWSHAGLVEIDLYEALAAGRLAERKAALEDAWADLHGRVSSPSLWGSVADQAQLVLAAYAPAAAGGEREAARSLLALLKGYAE